MFSPGSQVPEWEYRTGGAILCSPAIGPDGNVHIHSSDGCFHLVDANGKSVVEPVRVGDPLGWASPLIDKENNTWICRSDGGIAKVSPDGQMARRPFLRTRRRFDNTGLIHGDTLYIGCEDHFLYAVSMNGDRGENTWADSPQCGRTGCAINSSLVMAGEQELLVVSQDDHLYSFALDGQERWSIPLPGKCLGSPVVGGDGTIYLGISENPRDQDGRGILVAIKPNSRRISWRYQVDAPIESTPVIGDDGVLYFGDNAGVVHAIDLDGRPIWKAQFNSPVRSAGTIIADRLLAFGLDDGCLVVLKCSSARIADQGWPKMFGTMSQSGLRAD